MRSENRVMRKIEKFIHSSHRKIFREINSSFVKTLLSRIFCQKHSMANFCKLHTAGDDHDMDALLKVSRIALINWY